MYGIFSCRLVDSEVLWLNQTARNLTCGDLEIPHVVIQLGVTGLKKLELIYLMDLFGRRGRRSGMIYCVGGAFR